MNEEFAKKVRSAAIAAWFTLLFTAIILTVQWLGYMAVMYAKPGWVLGLLGPDITWKMLQHVTLPIFLVFRIIAFTILLTAIWLTMWAHQLKRG